MSTAKEVLWGAVERKEGGWKPAWKEEKRKGGGEVLSGATSQWKDENNKR